MNQIGEPFVQLTEVESSNNYAMGQVQARLAEHGASWFADHQTAGKGQRGKSWEMEPRQNIILSIVIEPKELEFANLFVFSASVAVACHNFFSKYAGDNTKIKWPNDIYWGDRKAGGILIENVLQGSEWKYAIVGIGININQVAFSQNLKNPVSLKQITGKTFYCVALAKELCSYIEKLWQQLQLKNFGEILNNYNSVLYKRNSKAQFKRGEVILDATVEGVNSSGELLVDTGKEEAWTYGEVDWLIDPK